MQCSSLIVVGYGPHMYVKAKKQPPHSMHYVSYNTKTTVIDLLPAKQPPSLIDITSFYKSVSTSGLLQWFDEFNQVKML